MSEEVNRKLPARNTTVQLLTLYTVLSATMHSVTGGQQTDRQTDRQTHYDANIRSYCVAVRSAKNRKC